MSDIRNWTPAEEATLRRLYLAGKRFEEIAATMDRTPRAVKNRAGTLRLAEERAKQPPPPKRKRPAGLHLTGPKTTNPSRQISPADQALIDQHLAEKGATQCGIGAHTGWKPDWMRNFA